MTAGKVLVTEVVASADNVVVLVKAKLTLVLTVDVSTSALLALALKGARIQNLPSIQ